VQTIRALIEGFLRGRYGYEGNQAYWALAGLLLVGALAVAVLRSTGPVLGVATLGVGLLVLRMPRLALPLLIGAVLLLAWVLFGPGQRAAF
jgi:hypothetical protein